MHIVGLLFIYSADSYRYFDLILWPHCDLGFIQSCNRNDYQECLLGVRQLVHEADKLASFMCQLPRNFGILNLL